MFIIYFIISAPKTVIQFNSVFFFNLQHIKNYKMIYRMFLDYLVKCNILIGLVKIREIIARNHLVFDIHDTEI